MKNLITILLLVAIYFSGAAKQSLEGKTLRKDRVWVYDVMEYSYANGTLEKSYQEIKVRCTGNTAAEGKDYLVFEAFPKEYFEDGSQMLLREEDGKIYRYFKNIKDYPDKPEGADIELLLYDFSMNPNDSYYTALARDNAGFAISYSWYNNLIITSKEDIVVNDETLARLGIQKDTSGGETYQIVEEAGPLNDGLLGALMYDKIDSSIYTKVGFNRLENLKENIILTAKDLGFVGIDEIAADTEDGDGRMFDLMGRELRGEPARGTVYIQNGRKHIAR